MTFSGHVQKISMKGRVSQIVNLGHSSNFMTTDGKNKLFFS